MLRARTLLERPDSFSDVLVRARSTKEVESEVPLKNLLSPPIIPAGHAIGLHGLCGSGKTHILYLLAIEAVLAGRSVIVFDADMKWDSSRLLDLLTVRLVGTASTVDGADFSDYLDLIYIYQPMSAAAWAEDAERAHDLCMNEIRDRAVRYVLVDSLSAFHWQSLTHDVKVNEVYHAIKALADKLSAMLVYTTWNIGFNYMMALPQSTRLEVQKKYVLQFTQGLEKARETREARAEVMARGIFYVCNETNGARIAFYANAKGCGVVH